MSDSNSTALADYRTAAPKFGHDVAVLVDDDGNFAVTCGVFIDFYPVYPTAITIEAGLPDDGFTVTLRIPVCRVRFVNQSEQVVGSPTPTQPLLGAAS
jgi:hypothetical protein